MVPNFKGDFVNQLPQQRGPAMPFYLDPTHPPSLTSSAPNHFVHFALVILKKIKKQGYNH